MKGKKIKLIEKYLGTFSESIGTQIKRLNLNGILIWKENFFFKRTDLMTGKIISYVFGGPLHS